MLSEQVQDGALFSDQLVVPLKKKAPILNWELDFALDNFLICTSDIFLWSWNNHIMFSWERKDATLLSEPRF